jgi:hypothetical protein
LVTIFLHFGDFPFCCGDASSSFVAEERSIYMTNLVLEWLQSIGGLKGLHLITIPSPLSVLLFLLLEAMGRINDEKAKLIYDVVNHLDGFYT